MPRIATASSPADRSSPSWTAGIRAPHDANTPPVTKNTTSVPLKGEDTRHGLPSKTMMQPAHRGGGQTPPAPGDRGSGQTTRAPGDRGSGQTTRAPADRGGGQTTRAPGDRGGDQTTLARGDHGGGDASLAAPGDLELVRRFVNTRDLELGTEQLATPADLDAFLGVRGSTGADLDRAIACREALR